ncbi:TPR repeat protein [Minicystis rosea]|nr:TPR repeat protein [Minicystis rosea]
MMRIVITGSILGILAAAGCTAGGDNTFHNTTGSGAGSVGGSNGTGGEIISFGDGGPGTGGSTSGGDTVVKPGCTSNCQDFPATPILDGAVPADPGSLFGAPGTFSSELCVAEPQLGSANAPGALVPANWLRMRFRVKPANGENLFEIRIKAPSQANELVVYTTNTIWSIPKEIWEAMGVKGNAIDQPITVTIRGVNSASPGTPTGATGTFTIAPVTAGGSMVYWAATSSEVTPSTSKLVGFYVGNETTIDALTIPEVQQTAILAEGGRDLRGMYSDPKGVPAGHVQCIGCHVSTPDGLAVGYTDHWPWNNVITTIEDKKAGQIPTWYTQGAQRLLNQPWMGMITFSKAHWKDGDRVGITSYASRDVGVGFTDSWGTGGDKLAWFELDTTVSIPWTQGQNAPTNQAIQAAQGTAWGFINLTGETRAASTPSWSHDGQTIVYTSTTKTQDGRLGDDAETDIYTVPYNNRMGGQVAPVQGAATPGVSEYYPSFSADDKLIAYNRAGATNGKIYYRPDGEVYVIPAAGGTPVRLAANDPPACTGQKSPGIINSWAKWSPTVLTHGNGNSYYWMIFSSARDYPGAFIVPANQYSPADTRSSQLYMAAVVRDKDGKITTYPAVYIWNQGPSSSNLTPAWDIFQIPPPPPVK